MKRVIMALDMNFLGTEGQSWISSNLIFKWSITSSLVIFTINHFIVSLCWELSSQSADLSVCDIEHYFK